MKGLPQLGHSSLCKDDFQSQLYFFYCSKLICCFTSWCQSKLEGTAGNEEKEIESCGVCQVRDNGPESNKTPRKVLGDPRARRFGWPGETLEGTQERQEESERTEINKGESKEVVRECYSFKDTSYV